MPFNVMGVVESEVLRPVARLGQFQNGTEERRVLRPGFQWGHLYFYAIGQLSPRRQHHHAVLDCAFVAHTLVLTRNPISSKQTCSGIRVTEHLPPRIKLLSLLPDKRTT